ncbi:MAG: ATP-dependent Clp protease ATP-binding subunit ClpA [Deltaproteobacteria bacterium]|nr:ATP-dependent Clp protease ATP-binding subunit ClpA [Deltaproteobacteria bacterium]MBW1957351.1 ATP-dependent Clp protease ATP-binding subunit ClpA [Deltaproteobacteria bacterium]MBW2012227.1 ATP-dependent Clp protease ATP-binding subunit ClpA [Deltaproteobacteria bacterium]MBW2087500.1 ATP-dependent Clp protease ATP-binding subunit ClpA [Deltaproteobacteria bacterium]MBW2319371.1 ATP-dependent Clp protease ATP-binding subunit ClpA [Deltaproteobacteria bacterium]
MISKELSETLGFAVREARKRRHEYVCIEHLLFAILYDKNGIEIIESCGGNILNLRNALELFFSQRMVSIPEGNEYVLQQTVGFQRVLQRAINHVRSAEKHEVAVSDILASIFQEKDSHAEYFLNAEGITRLDVLNYISHDVSKSPYKDESDELVKTDRKGKKKKGDPLEDFTIDLVKSASQGKLDPLIGREHEMERTIQVLCRRRKNNPVFVGDPGVGKTAMAEGLAIKIHNKSIPDLLKGVRIYSLDLGGLLAGTKFRGDFEQRLKGVLAALKKKKDAILFVDEIHTMVGAGATSRGSMDASNILKPVLATGDLRCIGSTTYEDYKNFFEKDRALSRRFEKIEILEPPIKENIQILKGLRSRYEDHHGIIYTDPALKAAVELSAKYINDRYLPDKAIDVIDEAGAFVRLSGPSSRKKIHPKDIEKIVAKMARIPTISVSTPDKTKLENLEGKLKQFVFGQDDAITSLVTSIKRSRAGLGTPERPIGSFLFAGPTGVGKTEVALQVSRNLGVQFLRFDMSEYMEKHAVARLIGAPPGYIGFDQGGLLTDSIRKHPHSVLLFDEIEKAHPDMFNILLQVLDHATLTDNNGKKADFRNVIIMMTSNAGAREMSSQTIGFGDKKYDTEDKGKKAVEKFFSPEFRNRLDGIIHFNALNEEIMEKVVDKFMKELKEQLAIKKISITLSSDARTWLARNGHDPRYGARPLTRLIQTEIKDMLSDEILFGQLEKGGEVFINTKNDKLTFDVKHRKFSNSN